MTVRPILVAALLSALIPAPSSAVGPTPPAASTTDSEGEPAPAAPEAEAAAETPDATVDTVPDDAAAEAPTTNEDSASEGTGAEDPAVETPPATAEETMPADGAAEAPDGGGPEDAAPAAEDPAVETAPATPEDAAPAESAPAGNGVEAPAEAPSSEPGPAPTTAPPPRSETPPAVPAPERTVAPPLRPAPPPHAARPPGADVGVAAPHRSGFDAAPRDPQEAIDEGRSAPSPRPAASAAPTPADDDGRLPSLADLKVTRDRPLFVPGRRGAVPVPVSPLPVVRLTAPPEPPPPPPLTLELRGVVTGPDLSVAIFAEPTAEKPLRMKAGDEHEGWHLTEIGRISATFRRGDEVSVLKLRPPGSSNVTAAAAVPPDLENPAVEQPGRPPRQVRRPAPPRRTPGRPTGGENE